MMETFARLFETPTTQVLVYLDYDTENDQTVLHQIGVVDGMRFDAALRWDGDNQEADGMKALASYDDDRAFRLVQTMRNVAGA